MTEPDRILIGEVQAERRRRNIWTAVIAIEAGICGDLAGVYSGFHATQFETTLSGLLALCWWGAFFLGFAIVAIGVTLALGALYYAIFE